MNRSNATHAAMARSWSTWGASRFLWIVGSLLMIVGDAWAQDDAQAGRQQIQVIQSAFQHAVEKARPSVVSVYLQDGQRRSQFGVDPGFPNGPGLGANDNPPASFGSGIVVRREGIVVTCYHVVRSAVEPGSGLDIVVQLDDGTLYSASIYAADPRSDLVSLKLTSPVPLDLVPMAIADGDKLYVGQLVLALGNPFGVAAPDGSISASMGIISNVRRQPARPAFGDPKYSIVMQGRTLVQTDARLNMGSSGSAMINLDGELVGIGMALAAAIGFEAPGGFAQPTDSLTRRVIETLADGREVEYGFIGISFQPTPTILDPGEPRLVGVTVQSVELPATQQAGLAPGDVITEVDGSPIRDLHDLILLVGSLPAGAKLRTKVVRGDSTKMLELPLGKFPVREEPIVTNKRPAWNGLRVDHLSTLIDAGGVRFGGQDRRLPPYGVVVREVQSDSPAAQKGIQPRQVIAEVDGKRIFDPDQFDELMATATGPIRLKFDGGNEVVLESPRKN